MLHAAKQKSKFWSLLSVVGICFLGCIEPFDAEFSDFESAIVVEATITNEMRSQRVFLSRTFEFESDGPRRESNADIRVMAGDVTYSFEETNPGVYESTQAFSAQPDIAYKLLIVTQDGRSYSSSDMTLPSVTQIDELRAERITNDNGEDGIAIFVDSFDPQGNSINYRYTYEETYRVIAPEWSPFDLEAESERSCNMVKVQKEDEQRVCYATDFSNGIILTSTSDLQEDRVNNFMVRFINRDNYIISHRYSILVKQLVQSNVAFTFFETLGEFSGNQSLFSETQPGFLEGNVFSEQDQEEKVLGFFDVASVTEQRIFFNYTDFYPNEPLPPYVDLCNESAPPLINEDGSCFLRPVIESNAARFSNDNNSPQTGEGPFFIVPRICGDCTVLGEVEVPEFWTD